ncbi:4-nitrophenylphosphatase [Aspergillus udagawae]|uniref:4-nitrophenylphosphatase n=1 Tax=Aspergillus udagawae TaxID=91492 RepID=A0ABQ1BD60_9EURO|nr:4-nitrophenylphosphatase [Aspergillus udagawae]GFF98324.1 4-nitrophenylphosphatase [Aspergillus udagawae]GFG18866.1 4-nitrophenylphosphatase [Aspergillus udagawae]GFG27131.1 4-nitrophenylphosphatase [Aspergillus udagawae]
MASSRRLSTPSDYAELLSRYDTWLFDCDGVIWSGDHALEGASKAIDFLRDHGKRVVFVTNNAARSRKMLKKKFDRLRIAASEDEIVSSASAAAAYLKEVLQFPADRKVFVMGMEGIEAELDVVNIKRCGGTSSEDNQFLPANDYSSLASKEAIDPSVGAVLCGFDMHMNYAKLCKAFKYLTREGAQGPVLAGERGGGCHFLLTNDDKVVPALGELWPGSGSLVTPLIASTKRDPIVIGKPHAPMLDTVKSLYNIDENRTIFVGDNLHTDILFASHGNIDSLLVLTGVTKVEDCQAEGIWPSFIIQSISNIVASEGGQSSIAAVGVDGTGAIHASL